MPNQMVDAFYGVDNHETFVEHLQGMINQVGNDGIYAGDNLFAFSRNLSFLRDPQFLKAATASIESRAEEGAVWRYAVLAWAANHGLRIPGDFVECACYRGTTARIVADYVDFAKVNKRYFLYDLFDHDDTMPHHGLSSHSAELYQQVQARFADIPNAIITQGRVPDILHSVAPDNIAFLHLDLNNAEAEIGALEFLFDRMSPGAVLILDDFGWLGYEAQQAIEIPWFAARGYKVLELPTGQGLLIK